MPELTLNQAAKASKKSKSTISKAINNGRLSAKKDDKGQCQIDTSELFRVFPAEQEEIREETQKKTHETAILEVKITHLERELGSLHKERERERASLENQLEREKEQANFWRQQATNFLTHQPETKKMDNKAVNPWLWVALFSTILASLFFSLGMYFLGVS
jgi:Lhr-like helicase